MKKGFGRGIQIIENEQGAIDLVYVEHSRLVFSSPIEIKQSFANWTQAVTFLKIWDTLNFIKWW